MFNLIGMEPPKYLELWQCPIANDCRRLRSRLGIIAVAFDPARALADRCKNKLVGLLGKLSCSEGLKSLSGDCAKKASQCD